MNSLLILIAKLLKSILIICVFFTVVFLAINFVLNREVYWNKLTIESNWLETLNKYRQDSGVPLVQEKKYYSRGAQKHADYLSLTPKNFFKGKYLNLHLENPASPFYSKLGATVGLGNIAWQYDQTLSSIDNLITLPFHAIGLLRENLTQVGFGSALVKAEGYYPGTRVTDIAVLKGISSRPRTKPILFPGANATVTVNKFEGENPEPREACGKNYQKFQGLPIFVSLLHNPSRKIEVKLTWRNGNVLKEGSQLCVVTENNFITTDKIYGPAGKQTIRQENLVLIIPKAPLSEGIYRVEIYEPGRKKIQWSFSYKKA